jgi:putative two-component system response regulator
MKKHILFVDDESRVLEGLHRILRDERSEWDLSFALSVREAVDLLAHWDADVVVTDINMPERNGLELLSEMQQSEAWKDIPVVLLTGMGEHDLKARALEMGAADLLNKPVDSLELKARIRSVLRMRDYQKELKDQNRLLEQKVMERTAELEQSHLEIIWRLGKASEYRDDETGNHVVRVACYARVIAQVLGMPGPFVERIFLASPLHDIGKLGVSDAILLKRGPLTPEERDIMRRHCAIGAQILRRDAKIMRVFQAWRGEGTAAEPKRASNPVLVMAARIALSHHERWDGAGYPAGLSGERIPMEARIVAVSDVYDALRSERPYKCPVPESQSIEIILGEKGRQFDPEVCAAFERCAAELHEIHANSWSEMEPAQVECQP